MGKQDAMRAKNEAILQAKQAGVLAAEKPPDEKPAASPPPPPKGGQGQGSETPTRAWFPETFLFEPRVVTDDSGAASVQVRVPDRLTTWRVLALAHGRNGAQGGATTSFLGTLPTYVDLVVPPFLTVGDEVRLPIQIVNTTDAAVASTLAIEARNATVTAPGGARTIPAQGSIVEYATIRADRAGTIALRARLGETDAVQRTIEVRPSGKPETITRSGTLAAPRTLTIEGPAGGDPATDRVRLLVFPGALALLRSELGVSLGRTGVADDAYALLLAGRAPSLLAMLGDKPDAAALRELSLVASQRAIRHGRTLDVASATQLTEAALAHPTNPVLARLGERAAAYLAQHQRPDGTFAGGTGWTLQRVLVATADATRAVGASSTDRHRTKAVQAKAGAAFARNQASVEDAYTAAAMLASGAVSGELAATLRDRINKAIKSSDDGAKYLDVGDGIVRADGTPPSRAEATALAVLALQTAPNAPLADLGATLLGAYHPLSGWGDGRTNLLCMQAVVELFKTPVPTGVKITLALDGKPVIDGILDRERLREVLALDAPTPSGVNGAHTFTVTADPPVAGLGFALSLHSWVPWPKHSTTAGLELALPIKLAGAVGKPIDVHLTAIAPSNLEVHIRHALPAGVQVDTPSLEALVSAGTLSRFETADGKLDLFIPPLQPGQTFTATYRVIPTLAGTLKSSASFIEAHTTQLAVPPTDWIIK
jgi:hypothetical protein